MSNQLGSSRLNDGTHTTARQGTNNSQYQRRLRDFCCIFQFPAMVIFEIISEPHCLEPRLTTSLPMAAMSRYIFFKLPAIVISCTGYAIAPFSIQNPAAPRE